MAVFKYKAIDPQGKTIEGVIEADLPSQAAKTLGDSRLTVISVNQIRGKIAGSREGGGIFPFKFLRSRVSLKEIALYARQFSILIRGSPLIISLVTLADQVENPTLRRVTKEIQADIEKGLSLSAALVKHRNIFSSFFISVVKSGEVTGKVGEVLDELSMYLEKEVKLRAKIQSALTYPVIVLSAAFIMVVGLTTFVIPGFASLLQELGVELPLPTKIVIAFSSILLRFWYIALALFSALVYFLRRFLKTQEGKRAKDRIILKLFLIGSFMRKAVLSQFAGTLSLLLESGVPLVEALRVMGEVIDNTIYAEDMVLLRTELERGKTFRSALGRSGLYPAMFMGLVGSGEESGALGETLKKLSEYYDGEVEYAIASLTAAIEPVMLIFLGGIIAFLVLTMFMPIFSLMSGIQ